MQVDDKSHAALHQNLSVLFYRKGKKAGKDGLAPIYCRVTINGIADEFSTGEKVSEGQLVKLANNSKVKMVSSDNPAHKIINKRLGQIKTDVERHFDFVTATGGYATPEKVIESYKSVPVNVQASNEKKENADLSLEIDRWIEAYLKFDKRLEKAQFNGTYFGSFIDVLNEEREALANNAKGIFERCEKLFSEKKRIKTLILAVDEVLVNFIELVLSGKRTASSLQKLWCRKTRYKKFLLDKYKKEDLPLSELESDFIPKLIKYCQTQFGNRDNHIMKFVQWLKEVVDKAVSNKWVQSNIFSNYRCHYDYKDREWMTIEMMVQLYTHEFKKDIHNRLRDVYVAQCFIGCSHVDLRNAGPQNIISGIDGKQWFTTGRQKTTGDETLPLLPIVQKIIERYKNDPRCLRLKRLLPVPCNQYYNKHLKLMAKELGWNIKLDTHTARYFFANEVTYNMGVALKTVARLLGQKSVRSAEHYTKANRVARSESMAMVESKLFGEGGKLTALMVDCKTDETEANGSDRHLFPVTQIRKASGENEALAESAPEPHAPVTGAKVIKMDRFTTFTPKPTH